MRLYDIDRAKGLAIFLVVYGHLTAVGFLVGNQWYKITNEMVYCFHMPFFMFLSGVTTYYTYKPLNSLGEYFAYTKKKFLRLAPAFCLFGIAILVGKLVVSKFLHVDNVPINPLDELLFIAANPKSSVVVSLWYIYVLFELLALFPLMLKILRGNVHVLLLIAFGLYFVNLTPLFLIDTLFKYLIFFSLGAVVVVHYESYLRMIDKYKVVFWMIFALSFLAMYFNFEKQSSKLIIGTCSIPALHALMRTEIAEKMPILIAWGSMSFIIYLMNTIMIGLVKAITLRYMSWDNENFLMVAPILLIAGLYGPIWIKRHVFSRIPLMDRITT